MKKIVITYGIISGATVAGFMLITMPMYVNGTLNMDTGELTGYTTMVIALSLVFFGVKSYRDKHLGGVISFGKAFKVGILITLIAAVMYALAWEVCYSQMSTQFLEKMDARQIEKMKRNGATEAEFKKAREDWDSFKKMYENPLIRFGITMTEMSPVGIIITLLSAALLRRKEFLPDQGSMQAGNG